MGVPITFLDKHNPEQFEVVGADYELANPVGLADGRTGTGRFYIKKGLDKPDSISDNQLSSAQLRLYARIVIRRKMQRDHGCSYNFLGQV
ncbi:MAG: hypothetical protein IKS43_05160 [Clostridia bacterium]|nr:hypothetical protein [Clostridia bacterium]